MPQLDIVAPARALARALLEGAFPADCLLCGAWLPWRQSGGVCPACWLALPWRPGHRLLRRGPLAAVFWAGEYGGDLRRLIHLLKFERFDPLGVPLGRAVAERVRRPLRELTARGVAAAPALAIPVPLHWTRRFGRGFNQAHLLARGVGRVLGIPVAPAHLARRRRGRRQIGLGRRERRAALAGVFQARAPRPLAGRTVLLVDDVTTTGATLEACALALRRAGAAAVIGCVVARTPRDGR